MKKFLLLAFLVGILVFNIQNQSKAEGLFYTNATYPVTATGVEVKDLARLKKGSASTTNVLWIVEVGNAGIDEAAKNGAIKKISYVDVNEKTVLIFWRQLTVNVYGE